MRVVKILSLIVVFATLFASCEEIINGLDNIDLGNSGNGTETGTTETETTETGDEIDYTNFVCLKTLNGHSNYVRSVAYSPDGTKIISGSYDGTIKIWNANTGQCLKTLEGHSDRVLSVAYSPDGTKIISG
jgi:WD40 repeat protein